MNPSSGRSVASTSLTPSSGKSEWEKKIAEQKRVLEASQSHVIHPESTVRAGNRDNPQVYKNRHTWSEDR